jgi:hypothetical protein
VPEKSVFCDLKRLRETQKRRSCWISLGIVQRTTRKPEGRRDTRISCNIPLIITSLDAAFPFPEPATVILVNPQGCAARFGRPLPLETAVQLEGLAKERKVIARVVNCVSLGPYEKFWIIGLALDERECLGSSESSPGLAGQPTHLGDAIEALALGE